MSEFSRRSVLGGAAGGVLAAAATAEGLAQGQQPPSGPTPASLTGTELPSFRFALGAMTPKVYDGGWLRAATVDQFPVSQKLAGALMQLVPGGLRELHWHSNAAEWAYVIKGQCRVTTIDPQNRSEVVDFGPVTFGISRAGMVIRSRASVMKIVCSFSFSTMDIFRNSALSVSATGWATSLPQCCRKAWACQPNALRIFPNARSLSPRVRCRLRSPPTGQGRSMRLR